MRLILAAVTAGIAVCLPLSSCSAAISLKHIYTADGYSGSLRFLSPVAAHLDPKRPEIYIADAGRDMLVTLGTDGRPLGYFYHRLRGRTEKREPAGIAVNSKGTVFVSDASENRIYMYDYRGESSGFILLPDGKSSPSLPGKLAVDADDNLYVAVRNAGKVLVLDSAGRFKTEISSPSSNSEMACCDVAVDGSGNIYALSTKGPAVRIFDKLGNQDREFGKHEPGPTGFSGPAGIDVDGKGRLWIADAVSQVVKVFQSDGTYIRMFGGLGSGEGAFFSPVDVCINRSTNTLFVLEKNGRRIQAFTIEDR